jgi:hypothetical protein
MDSGKGKYSDGDKDASRPNGTVRAWPMDKTRPAPALSSGYPSFRGELVMVQAARTRESCRRN